MSFAAAAAAAVAAGAPSGPDLTPPTPDLEVERRGPLFAVGNVAPGDVHLRCIGVRNAGSAPTSVAMHLDGRPQGTGLARYITMSVERGRRSGGSGCRGFRRDRGRSIVFTGRLAAFPVDAARPLADGGRPLRPGDERVYRISWSVVDEPDAAGRTATDVSFAWSARSW